ncbi:MAG: SUMF1/EgtB/PvdO family nonheme iron enzyme [Planctomycetota bacterium]
MPFGAGLPAGCLSHLRAGTRSLEVMDDPKLPDPDSQAVIDAFLLRFLEDRHAGTSRTLSDYQDEFPGYGGVIEAEYARLSTSAGEDAAEFGEVESDDPAVEEIDGYELKELIGQGGMGMVFRAQQREPFERQVALKVIKLGMDTREIVARFRIERQALALLDHPNVARVYDAGVTKGGRPYFAMEYADGAAITTVCDGDRLGLTDRLRLFLDVCAAVQHAHQRGVIHRDLKPSNVLVAKRDGGYEPKVIDFGIAKCTQSSSPQGTLQTELGQIIGTPGYMSPEQALHGGFDIDTRTDVYALGVLLYELLVGELPFRLEAGETGKDLAERVAEQDVRRPSTRLLEQGRLEQGRREQCEERLRAVLEARSTPTAKGLAASVRGDLDWITLRALEKDRERRYASVADLAADIERHLNHEPVLAGPPAWSYRAKKFVRRHRLSLSVGVSLLLLASLVFTLTTHFSERRHREERDGRVTSLLEGGRSKRNEYLELRAGLGEVEKAWKSIVLARDPWIASWRREDEFASWRRVEEAKSEIERRFSAAMLAFHQAKELAAEGSNLEQSALAELAGLYARRFRESYWGGDAKLSPEFFRGLVQSLGVDGADWSAERTELVLRTNPPGAEIHCFRYEEIEARRVPVPFRPDGERTEDPRRTVLEVERVWPGFDSTPLEAGDRLLSIDAAELRSEGELGRILDKVAKGQNLELEVERGGQPVRLSWVPFPDREIADASRESASDLRTLVGLSFEAYPIRLSDQSRVGRTRDADFVLALPEGSYLLYLVKDGYETLRYPLHIPLLPNSEPSLTLRLLEKGTSPKDFVRVPAGVFACGGDDLVDGSRDASYEPVDEFYISKYEVTVRQYLRFLNAPENRDRMEQGGYAEPRVDWRTYPIGPRHLIDFVRGRDKNAETLRVRLVPYNKASALFVKKDAEWTPSPTLRSLDWPVLGLSLLAGLEYAHWLTEQSKDYDYRLPYDLEWEKAARGVDRRIHVWGDYPLFTFANTNLGMPPGSRRPAPVGSYPSDESVYGVRDLTGSVSEPTLTSRDSKRSFLIRRGGNWWNADEYLLRASNRNGTLPTAGAIDCGIRLVAVRRSR